MSLSGAAGYVQSAAFNPNLQKPNFSSSRTAVSGSLQTRGTHRKWVDRSHLLTTLRLTLSLALRRASTTSKFLSQPTPRWHTTYKPCKRSTHACMEASGIFCLQHTLYTVSSIITHMRAAFMLTFFNACIKTLKEVVLYVDGLLNVAWLGHGVMTSLRTFGKLLLRSNHSAITFWSSQSILAANHCKYRFITAATIIHQLVSCQRIDIGASWVFDRQSGHRCGADQRSSTQFS
jgi:hypothetical protein